MNLRTQDKPSVAAAKAAISTATGYRIDADPRLPSQKRKPRTRRRPDPLAGIFEQEVLPLLQREPHLRAVTIFEELLRPPELSHRAQLTLGRVSYAVVLDAWSRRVVGWSMARCLRTERAPAAEHGDLAATAAGGGCTTATRTRSTRRLRAAAPAGRGATVDRRGGVAYGNSLCESLLCDAGV